MPIDFPTRRLGFEGGYRPSVEPTALTSGMPDCQNVNILPAKSGFESIAGASRKNVGAIFDTDDGGLYVLKFSRSILDMDSPATGIAVYDETGSKLLGVTAHQGELATDYTGSPTRIQALTRNGANQVPAMVNINGKTLICDANNFWHVWDGIDMHRAGGNPPRIRPTISVKGTDTSIEKCEGASAGNGTWIVH